MELGPLLGRGSFGRVYKGRWNSSLVAIKIVDHVAAGGPADAAKTALEDQRVAREALLSASLSHPSAPPGPRCGPGRAARARRRGARRLRSPPWTESRQSLCVTRRATAQGLS